MWFGFGEVVVQEVVYDIVILFDFGQYGSDLIDYGIVDFIWVFLQFEIGVCIVVGQQCVFLQIVEEVFYQFLCWCGLEVD